MGRRQAPGGESSLGYLFGGGADKPAAVVPVQQKTIAVTPVEAKPAPLSNATNRECSAKPHEVNQANAVPLGRDFNNYARSEGQNTGNFITDRPSSRVLSAPGGSSSIGYLFGGQ
eukprot:jgi/Mesen1/7492/ME000039S06701